MLKKALKKRLKCGQNFAKKMESVLTSVDGPTLFGPVRSFWSPTRSDPKYFNFFRSGPIRPVHFGARPDPIRNMLIFFRPGTIRPIDFSARPEPKYLHNFSARYNSAEKLYLKKLLFVWWWTKWYIFWSGSCVFASQSEHVLHTFNTPFRDP